MKFSSGNGNHHFPAHNLAFHVGIRIVLAHIVPVGRDWLMGSKLFEPGIKILMQPPFIIIDKNTCGNMHGIYQTEPFLHPRFPNEVGHLRRYVDKLSLLSGLKPEFLSEGFHTDYYEAYF